MRQCVGAKSDETDVELNGETDAEDKEDGRRDTMTGGEEHPWPTDCLRTQRAHDHTSTIQMMVQVLCDGTWRELTAQEIGCSRRLGVLHCVNGLWVPCRERESEEQVAPVLVIRERSYKMTWAMLVPRKGTEFSGIAERAAKFIDQLGHNSVTLRCDSEPVIEALARELAPARREESQTVLERTPVGKKTVQCDPRRHGGARGFSDQNTEGRRKDTSCWLTRICCIATTLLQRLAWCEI